MSALTVCSSCLEISVMSPCAVCREDRAERQRSYKARYDAKRPSAHARGLGRKHQELARAQVAEVPWCQQPMPDGGVCGATDDLTGGHIIARYFGGPAVPENYMTLCRPHNSSDGARIRWRHLRPQGE